MEKTANKQTRQSRQRQRTDLYWLNKMAPNPVPKAPNIYAEMLKDAALITAVWIVFLTFAAICATEVG